MIIITVSKPPRYHMNVLILNKFKVNILQIYQIWQSIYNLFLSQNRANESMYYSDTVMPSFRGVWT